MKNKKGLILTLAGLLIALCVVFEYGMPSDAAAKAYFVDVNTNGEQIQKNNFSGYKYTLKGYKKDGSSESITFYSPDKLAKNKKFKIHVTNNQFVANYKQVKKLPSTIQYYAEQ
ncbi:YxeA family protein [Listeria rocourtiae]|uniref:YxeA family protein n=1 Tax=Listeria rocourtiae TaxID=647910 RepID=UPI0016250044|nr:YxeA family protein [Listeria rocourtiae]MBC1435659.1 YxeA family protein [Listeria rocourtiae]MBC1605176.1 YxeA family protein [Listeria rocourtiae]